MDKEWSDKFRKMQTAIGKKKSFKDGVGFLLELRSDVFGQIASIVNTFPDEAFGEMPFPGADGYHSKTLAYSMWHIFRIEDITANTLIAGKEQILFRDGWLSKTKSPIVTTGNELKGEEIARFSEAVDVKALFDYCKAVMEETNGMLEGLAYEDLKRRFTPEDRERVVESGSVSSDEAAFWLIDYWCGKDVLGLIRMPFSRHWIMHVEAMRRIKNRLVKTARKGVDPVAYCGLSCDHCFLGEWCGSCRTRYNTCSYATMFPDRVCPNAACCRERGYDGCWECGELATCEKGFYAGGNDTNAVRAMAFFIGKHGKKELKRVLDNLHERYDFKKVQEILGSDTEEGLRILEEAR